MHLASEGARWAGIVAWRTCGVCPWTHALRNDSLIAVHEHHRTRRRLAGADEAHLSLLCVRAPRHDLGVPRRWVGHGVDVAPAVDRLPLERRRFGGVALTGSELTAD